MRIENLLEPKRLEGLNEPTRFVVQRKFPGPAVTITGQKSEFRFGQIPRMIVECNFNSAGIVLERLDNHVLDSIVVDRATGMAVDISTCRQSHFRTMQVTECEADLAVRIRTQWKTGDSPNACRFDYLSIYGCKVQECLALEGNGTEVGTIRRLSFGMVFLHGCWAAQLSKMPEEQRTRFAKHHIGTMLAMRNVDRCRFESLAITCDRDTEYVFLAEKSRRIAIAGDALVHRAEQVQIGSWAKDNGFEVGVRR